MGTGGQKGRQVSYDKIATMIQDKGLGATAPFEKLSTQLENKLAQVGKDLRAGLDVLTEGVLFTLQTIASAIEGIVLGIKAIIDFFKTWF